MFDQLVGTCDLSEGHNFRDVQSLPSRLKCLVEVASGLRLCLGRHIIAADEEDSGIHKDKLPDRSFRRGHIGGISRN